MILLPLPLGLEPLQLLEGRSHGGSALVHTGAEEPMAVCNRNPVRKKKRQNPLSNAPSSRQIHQRRVGGCIQRFRDSNQLGEAILGTASKEAKEKSHNAASLLRTLNSLQHLLRTHLPHACAQAYLSLLSFRSFLLSLSRCPVSWQGLGSRPRLPS